MIHLDPPRLCAPIALLASSVLCSGAAANITWSISPLSGYAYKVSQMPDFDQLRTIGMGKPGFPNDGNMYCAPTATANAAAYVNYHGYPDILPVLGQTWGEWLTYGNPQYIVSNIGIDLLASAMGTHPVNGTGGAGFLDGASAYFNSDWFTVQTVWSSPSTPITAITLFTAGAQGPHPSLILPTVGWYTQNGDTLTRNGGHVLTLTEVGGTTSGDYLTWRDPANTGGDSMFSQSEFKSQYYTLTNSSKKVNGVSRTMARVNGYGSGWLDGYMRITPIYGLVAKPGFLVFKYIQPKVLEFQNDDDKEITISNLPVIDMSLMPDSGKSVYLTKPVGAAGKVSMFNPTDQTSSEIPVPIADPKKVVTGRRGEIYVLDGPKMIKCMQPPASATAGWSVVNIFPPFNLADLAYDDFQDRLVGLSAEAKQMWIRPYCDGSTDCPVTGVALPVEIPAMNPNLASMDVDGKTGVIWLTSGNLTKIYGLSDQGGVAGRGGREGGVAAGWTSIYTITDPLIVNPRGLAVDNIGRICFESNGVLRVLMNGKDGYVEDVDNPMNGKTGISSIVLMPQSRTNFDPALHDGPGWTNNVLPTEFGPDVVDCDADLDVNNVVDGADLGLLLAQWGSDGTADFNDDDVVDGADLGILLSLWGNCP